MATPTTSELLSHAGQYFAHDVSPELRPSAKEVMSEGARWLKGLRSSKVKGVPIDNGSSPPRSYGAAQPWPEPVPDEEDSWARYTSGRNRSTSSANWLYGGVGATGIVRAPSVASTATEKDPEDAAWTVWNEEEAMRQALEASQLAFEGVAMHQGVPEASSSHEDEDADLQRAIRESAALAEAELRRQREQERQDEELQRVIRETSIKGKQAAPRRRSTTAEEKEELRRAMALSLQESGSPTSPQVGPSSALAASQATGLAVETPPVMAGAPPYPPPYNAAASASTKSAAPPLPARAPPAVPGSSAGPTGTSPPSDTLVDAPGPMRGGPPLPHRPPPLPPKDPARPLVDSPSNDAAPSAVTPSGQSRSGTGDSYFAANALGCSSHPARTGDDSLSPPLGDPRRPSLSPVGSDRTARRNSSGGLGFNDDEEESFISGFGNVAFDPTGENLPHGGYRTRSPTQLSRLTERTEPGLQTPSLNDSTMALDGYNTRKSSGTSAIETGPSSDTVHQPPNSAVTARQSAENEVTTPLAESSSRPPIQSAITNASSVYADARSTSSDPAVTAEATRLTPPESPFGESLTFGYETDDRVNAIPIPPGLPESIILSSEVGEDTFSRPHGAFAIEAPTWSTLLRGLMWYGNTRLEAAARDTERTRAEVALAATFTGATSDRAAFVRLTVRILVSTAEGADTGAGEQATSSPGRLRLPLPDRVLLPSTFAELAVSLYTLRHLAAIACSTQPGKEPTASYRGLRQLGHAIERLAGEHGEGKKPAAEEGKLLRRLRMRLQRGGTTKGKEPAKI